ncbi:LLM class F420-dependent oxidoreductase [Streptomyces sp. NBC_00841]|uniref:LLM class F420-dependent oxidoreductase n=1 Tax=unclassified Streptomyces TaxID=2593676 RepID=UPI00224CFE69|nr:MULTISPECIES: LLM class F420-dependent oxidoreductase [unclassified Streptomyces]MCX4530180.1 LLM class F420-dependent oxidoreductase [Streptomyces sp. NBC_01669]WSA04038.1 LLM class F420-dependent oxidoreductase [Streptomyces sp. NBC_00841]
MGFSDSGAHQARAIGRYGLWTTALHAPDSSRDTEVAEAAAELEELGYGALWLGGSGVEHAAPLIEATSAITVATGILSIWQYEAQDTAARWSALEAAHPGRFLLGLGVSHAGLAEQYKRPYAAMNDYLSALDTAGVPAGRRVLAALGPKMLELARDRAAGAHPYLVTPEHTAQAREKLGKGPLLAPEFTVVLEADPDRARATARRTLAFYLLLPNYTNNWLRLGFTEDDFAGGGSDHLIDTLFGWGDEQRVRERIDAFLDAGADHVAVQTLAPDSDQAALPREHWRRLAAALDL